MIENCSCGAEPRIEFGFSCTFKPRTVIYCPNCGKTAQKIGIDGISIFDLWKEEIKTGGKEDGEK